jgi:cyclopropane fatty-acyl-phospholipid synthase-like methyltransferase
MKLPPEALKRISSRVATHWDRFYVPSKLASDPVYSAVASELNSSTLPVLDIGCGMGLLMHYLRELGHDVPVTGFDYDERKIASARFMAAGMSDVSFSVGDARVDLPDHAGHVVILDILQFFTPEEQELLLRAAAARVASKGKLIIRSGLADDSWRFRVTVFGDWIAKATLWMKSGPVAYPTADQFRRVLEEAGLHVSITPLWGGTPFNNHLIVAQSAKSEATS